MLTILHQLTKRSQTSVLQKFAQHRPPHRVLLPHRPFASQVTQDYKKTMQKGRETLKEKIESTNFSKIDHATQTKFAVPDYTVSPERMQVKMNLRQEDYKKG